MKLLVFGAGYSGRAIAREMSGRAAWIAGTTRRPDKFARLEAAGMKPLLFDGAPLESPLLAAIGEATHLCVAAGPGSEGDPVLAAAGEAIRAAPALRWIGYLSTVGVYGDHQGAWVDEDAECRPGKGRSEGRLAAEEAWRALGRERGLPVAVLRLSGIYGPGRNAFVSLSDGTARRIVKPGQVFNRIHVDDIAGAFAHLARRETAGVFNVTDDEPSPAEDVIVHAAGLMGVEPPPAVPFEEASMSPMALSFWGEVKRVSNARLKAAGYRLRMPDYRSALGLMWSRGEWRSGD